MISTELLIAMPVPVSIAKKRTPIDQMSLDLPSYSSPDSISGATDSGVPQAVLQRESASSSLLNLQEEKTKFSLHPAKL